MLGESNKEDAFHSPVKKTSFFSPPFSNKPPVKKSSTEAVLPDLFLSQNGPDAKSRNQNFKVCVRVRPLIPREMLSGGNTCLEISPDHRSVQIYKPSPGSLLPSNSNPRTLVQTGAGESTTREHTFSFDRAYTPSTSQVEVYSTAVRPVVLNILEGYNGTIIAFGQTSAGKTYTMEGEHGTEGAKGIIPRVAEEIFSYIEESSNSASRFLVRASFLQIYNEQLQDLLRPPKQGQPKQPLKIREIPTGVYVQGLTETVAKTPQEIIDLMRRGAQNRATARTEMNWKSSRSHALFSIIVEHSELSKITNKKIITIGKLNLVDLAGSERVKDSGAQGERLEEACKINSSLSTLGKVILSLTSGSKGKLHVPYRESKITFLLRDSLGGNCRTTLITNVTPAAANYNETLNTLRFGNNAKSVRNDARINQDMSEQGLLLTYERELQRLRGALEEACNKELSSSQDSGRLQLLECELKGAHEMNEQVQLQLKQSEQEVDSARREKDRLLNKITAMENQLLVGGKHVKEMPEFLRAVEEVEQEMSKQYEERIRELEHERERERSEKEQLQRRLETFEVAGTAVPPHGAWGDTNCEQLQAYADAMCHSVTGIPLLGPDISVGFTGLAAAEWFMNNMAGVESMEHAVRIGQQLMEYGVVVGASGCEIFSAGESDLFQFSPLYCGAGSPVYRDNPHYMISSPSMHSRPYSLGSYNSYLTLSPTPSPSTMEASQLEDRPHAFSAMSMNTESLYEASIGSGGITALHSAASKGEAILVKSLVPTHGVDCRDSHGRTPLMHSVIGGRARCAVMLMRMGADVHMTDANGRTALLWSAYYGHLDVMRVLIKHDKRVLDFVDPDGRTALHWATKPDSPDCLRLLAKHCLKELVTVQDKDDSTALIWAVLMGHPVHLNVLLKQCPLADLTQGDTMGFTALHLAVSTKQEGCCQVILKHSLEVAGLPDIHGRLPIHLAVIESTTLEILHTLISLDDRFSGLNATDKKMATPLHWAAALNNVDMVKLLLESGATSDVKDLRGYAPLHYALTKKHTEVVKVFEQFNRPHSTISTSPSLSSEFTNSNIQTQTSAKYFQKVRKN